MSARGAVRLARPDDAEPLCLLNARFNGAGLCTAAQVRAALACPGSEVVAVCELDGTLAGFACAQVKRSFCYPRPTAEITELFVDAPFRRQDIARRLLAFLEAHCMQAHGVDGFTLLTGADNAPAQALYRAMGYRAEDERAFAKPANR